MKTYNYKISYVAAICLVGVFIINTLFPFILIGDLLYLGCVVIVFQQTKQIIAGFSVAAFLLIAANIIMNNNAGKITALEWANHTLSLALAVFIMVYIAVNERKQNQLTKEKEQRYLKSLEEMLFMTSHKVRKPVANMIGLMALLTDSDAVLSDEEIDTYFKYMGVAVIEVDDFLRELSAFIERSGRPVQEKGIRKKHFVFRAADKNTPTEDGYLQWSA